MTRRSITKAKQRDVALPAPTIPKIPPTQVLPRLAALKTTPIAQLKQQWRELFGKEPPPFSRSYITSRLACRVQELAYGGLKPETRARLEALGEQLDGGNVVLRRIRADSRPLPGTRLIREHDGVQHVVTVRPDDFEYEGRPYRSLSAIARHITGTRWNGWTFFGLRPTGGCGMSRKKAPADTIMPATTKKLRCAVYTRKSTDEGLDREFNTLDAQRDACEAYVASQKAEGWLLVRDRYDDGGFSGGSLERPAPRRLLADIEQGKVDVIVVYKIDRLSRSLMDFAKLVETMETHGVTFVSVTQSFNTTTSMGRLTLNILLSFAQFEREVIGERIRDKFAASRARGMWMGGRVPLGYDIHNRKLVVNDAEAAVVRQVFEAVIAKETGPEAALHLREAGAKTKSGRLMDRGDVYKLIHNQTYLGYATHKGNIYRGEHEAIVPRELWDRAHAVLQISPRSRAAQNRRQAPALLKGLLYGADGRALSPTHTRKGGRLYRYYVAQRVMKGDAAGDDSIVRRVSAAQIEAAVMSQVRALLRQPEIVVGTWLTARKETPDVTEREVRDALHRLDPLWDALFPAEQARIVRALVERVVVGPAGADIRLRVERLAGLVRDLTAIAPEALRAAA